MMLRRIAGLGIAVLALSLTGCGESSNSAALPGSTSASPSPSLTPISDVVDSILGDNQQNPTEAQLGRIVQAWWDRFTPEKQSQVCVMLADRGWVYTRRHHVDPAWITNQYGQLDAERSINFNLYAQQLLRDACP